VSEARDDGNRQYEGRQSGSGQSGSGQSGSGQSGNRQSGSGQSGGRQSKPASDPVADFQRWLMRAGARSMAHQVAGNVRRTLGQQRRNSKGSGDVWDTATTELPPGEPPECQWCPVCQAARRLRESGPGLGSKLADAGGVVASVLQDTLSALTTPPANGTGAAHKDAASKPAASNAAASKPAASKPAASKTEAGKAEVAEENAPS
jgi:hypothetical protein